MVARYPGYSNRAGGWARQNSRTASITRSGRSRLLMWPAPSIVTSVVSGMASSYARATVRPAV